MLSSTMHMCDQLVRGSNTPPDAIVVRDAKQIVHAGVGINLEGKSVLMVSMQILVRWLMWRMLIVVLLSNRDVSGTGVNLSLVCCCSTSKDGVVGVGRCCCWSRVSTVLV
jgi:hypothetical protein